MYFTHFKLSKQYKPALKDDKEKTKIRYCIMVIYIELVCLCLLVIENDDRIIDFVNIDKIFWWPPPMYCSLKVIFGFLVMRAERRNFLRSVNNIRCL